MGWRGGQEEGGCGRMALMLGLLSAASAPLRFGLRRTLQRSSFTAALGKLSPTLLNGQTNRVRPDVLYLLVLL